MKNSNLVSIIIITFGRKNIYDLINSLLNQKIDLIKIQIIIISEVVLEKDKISHDYIKVYYLESGKGLGFYRNRGIDFSEGSILVFIDDDEYISNEYYLINLIAPIISGKESITTSGYLIPLNQGYIADSVSSLGFPGGGSIGFKRMWNVNKKGYTAHICTGNFAIKKEIINSISGFDENLKFGNEDIDLAERLMANNYKIKYIEDATINHFPRKNLIEFIKWHIKRGRAVHEFKKVRKIKNKYYKNRFNSTIFILKKFIFTKFFPMIIFLIIIQYFSNIIGYFLESIKGSK